MQQCFVKLDVSFLCHLLHASTPMCNTPPPTSPLPPPSLPNSQLQRNQLTGPIPAAICSLSGLTLMQVLLKLASCTFKPCLLCTPHPPSHFLTLMQVLLKLASCALKACLLCTPHPPSHVLTLMQVLLKHSSCALKVCLLCTPILPPPSALCSPSFFRRLMNSHPYAVAVEIALKNNLLCNLHPSSTILPRLSSYSHPSFTLPSSPLAMLIPPSCPHICLSSGNHFVLLADAMAFNPSVRSSLVTYLSQRTTLLLLSCFSSYP